MKNTYTDLNTQAREIFLKCGAKPLYEIDGKIYQPLDGYRLKEYKKKNEKAPLERGIMVDGEYYVIPAEAERILNIGDKRIKYHLKKPHALIRKHQKGDRTYYCVQDMINYFGDKLNPFAALVKNPKESFRYLYKNGVNILAGDLGTIYNLDTYKDIGGEAPSGNGHLQVSIGGILLGSHKIIAEAWCDNKLNKDVVHHINGIKTDNRAENLIYVTSAQHGRAGVLLSAKEIAATDEEKVRTEKKYDDYIAMIREENKFEY